MRVLFIGDVFGGIGRRILAERLKSLRQELSIDVCIANGENAAGGRGISTAIAKKFRKYGVDVITGGNHSFANQEGYKALQEGEHTLRPLNYPEGNIGKGSTIYTLGDGRKIAVVNLQGRTFFSEKLECPFRKGLEAVEALREHTHTILIDFHAEATAEKKALFFYLDGKVSALVGTHTHVQTADEMISAQGTAFLTDVGFTGAADSAIGMKQEPVIRHFLLQTFVRYEPAHEGPTINAACIDIDDATGKARAIARISERITFQGTGEDPDEATD